MPKNLSTEETYARAIYSEHVLNAYNTENALIKISKEIEFYVQNNNSLSTHSIKSVSKALNKYDKNLNDKITSILLTKAKNFILADVKEAVALYDGDLEQFKQKSLPFTMAIQFLIYLLDLTYENSDEDIVIKRLSDHTYGAIKKLIHERKLKNKKILSFLRESLNFLDEDRRVHNLYKFHDRKTPAFRDIKKIIIVINMKVADILMINEIAFQIMNIKITATEWKILRQLEVVREFIDDQEDIYEDVTHNHEQFNSISQIKKLRIDLRDVLKKECEKLLRLINQSNNNERKEELFKRYNILTLKDISRHFGHRFVPKF